MRGVTAPSGGAPMRRGRLRCRPRCKLDAGGALWRFVWHHLFTSTGLQDSLHGQIAAARRATHPDDRQARVSHVPGLFSDPPHTWQVGSSENTHGHLRRFLPKGPGLRQVTQRDLGHIAKLLNDRPRKTFGWKPPAQALAEEIAKSAKSGAIGP